MVTPVQYDPALQHNIPNLRVTTQGALEDANFRDFYNATGGLTRSGLPTAEVFEEKPGVLVQYYQRGVVEWKTSSVNPSVYTIQRVLAWDFIGGGQGGAPDLGVEPGLTNHHPGTLLGRWGHKVSNTSVEGVAIGFPDLFSALGGVASFGFPKTDARRDSHPQAVLTRVGSNPNIIRQYFQAAVLEYHPDAAPGQNVKLALLGDYLRNIRYPNESWTQLAPFKPTQPLDVGASLSVG